MKKKKLTLDDLKIESFVTTVGFQEATKLYGGWSISNASGDDCNGGGLTGNGTGGGNSVNVPGGPCDPTQTTVKCNTTSDCGNPGGGTTTDPGTGTTPGGGTTTPGGDPPYRGSLDCPPTLDGTQCYG